MKESYRKDLASRPGPESCVRTGNCAGEALTGVHVGQVLSCEIRCPGRRRRYPRRKATRVETLWRVSTTALRSRRP